jgi:PTH2 family peptidyl-tRNA hydrolase
MKGDTKQVLIWRNDLKVRKGKIAAQMAHASMSFLTKKGHMVQDLEHGDLGADQMSLYFKNESPFLYEYFYEINHWLNNSFRKICCYVNDEKELRDLHEKALEAGLMSYLIEDNGATEFGGIKTATCIAIGPHYDERFEGITDNLDLL